MANNFNLDNLDELIELDDLSEVEDDDFNLNQSYSEEDDDETGEPVKKPKKPTNNLVNILIGALAIIVVLIIGVSFAGKLMKPKTPSTEEVSGKGPTYTSGSEEDEEEVPEDEEVVKDKGSNSSNNNVTEDIINGDSKDNKTVYDERGNVIDKDAIDPGMPDFDRSKNTETSNIVYDADDFIKDLNGINVPAVYNVDKTKYVNLFVNYEARRAIMDDGMELYWLEITYEDKPYRCQVPFYIFKDMAKKGICVVEAEVLTLSGGEMIISYMQVVPDYADMINK